MKQNIKIAEVSQQRHEKIRIKGQIVRQSTHLFSARNGQLIAASRSHKLSISRDIRFQLKRFFGRKYDLVLFILKKASFDAVLPRGYLEEIFGYNKDHLSELFKELEVMGLVSVVQIYGKANQFSLGPAALDNLIRKSLLSFLPTLSFVLGSSLLLSPNIQIENPLLKSKEKTTKNIGIGKKNNKKVTFEQKLFDAFPMFSYIAKKYPNPNPIKKENLVLKSLEITEAGIANLLPYPQSAITWADEQLAIALAQGSMREPFAFLVKKANIWCEERGMRPNWRPMYDAYQSQSITNDMPRFSNVLIASPNKSKRSYTHKAVTHDGREICCRFADMNNSERAQLLTKHRIAYIMTDRGPQPITEIHKDKLTCSHGRD